MAPSNSMKTRMAAGHLALGLGVGLVTSSTLPLLAIQAGYDWLFIDLEHSTLSIGEAADLSTAAAAAGITPVVRLAKTSIGEASRLLDNGVHGIIMPHVDTPEEAAHFVELCKYAPQGRRSWGGPAPQLGFPQFPAASLMEDANGLTLAVAMIESRQGVDEADRIAATPGLDGVFVGAVDLSIDLGQSGNVTHPDVVSAVDRVVSAAKRNGLHAGLGGVFGRNAVDIYRALPFDFILAGIDYRLLAAAITERASAWKPVSEGPR